jgi:arylsulfatase A-like enzyme
MSNATSTGGITRRKALASALGTAVLVAGPPARARAQTKKPNIIYIMADDLGFADLSCYGRREYRTPTLDKLAAEGMRFTSAYANSAVCSATRIGLITGRYQYRLRVGLEEPLNSRGIGLDPSHPTLPGQLRKAGYKTTLVGKWHLGWLPKFGPLKSGYDEFWGLYGGGVDYFSHDFNGEPDLWDGETPIEKIGYMTDLLADRSIETLERRAKDRKPFFLSLHFTAPHWPWEGNDAQGKAESARIKGGGARGGLFHYDSGSMATYASMVTALDSNIGRVLQRLKELGLDRDTIVIFTSDNGGERFSDTWPFSGKKTELLEGGMRIPALVRWTDKIPAGSTNDTPFMSIDWMPTLLNIAGGAPDPAYPVDGVDIAPLLAGGTLPERPMFWRYKHKHQRALRRGRLKYLRMNDNEFLFDVFADPLERANLKDRQPENFAALKAEFEAWSATMLDADDISTSGNAPANWADHFSPGS